MMPVTSLFLVTLMSNIMLDHATSSQDGYHCGNVTRPQSITSQNNSSSGNNDDSHYQCVKCFFPQNCLENNTCIPGTYGETCERCLRNQVNQTDFYRVGNTCIACNQIPWTAIGFGVYILLFILVIAISGFSVSVCTKFKILCHFLQLAYLSFMIKVRWSYLLQQTLAVVSFSCFNSNLAPVCLFPSLPAIVQHYLEWATSILIVVGVYIGAFFVDRSMGLVLSKEREDAGRDKIWHKRSTFRRLVFFIILMMYMPAAITAIHTFSCSDTVPYNVVLDQTRDVFLFEQNESCDKIVFQTLHFFVTLLLIVNVIFFPLMVLLFSLRQKKWSLLEEERIYSGYVYDSYKMRWCFWEAIPMLRKIVYILVTDTYPLSTYIQSLVQLSVTGAYLLAIFTLRPFRSYNWKCTSDVFNMHIIYEVLCNVAVGLIQGVALMITMNIYIAELDYVVISCIAVAVITGIVLLLAVPLEAQNDKEKFYDTKKDDKEEDDDLNTQTNSVGVKGLLRIKKVKVAPTPDSNLPTRQKNISF